MPLKTDRYPIPGKDCVSTNLRPDRTLSSAGPLPDVPVFPLNPRQAWWTWEITTDPNTPITGFPFASSHATQFLVQFVWNGTQSFSGAFSAFVIDRRPLLVGLPVAVTLVPFSIVKNEIGISVASELPGNPSSF